MEINHFILIRCSSFASKSQFAVCPFLVHLQLSPGLARSSPLSSEVLWLRYVFSLYPKKSFAKSDLQKTDHSCTNRIGNWKVINFVGKYAAEVLISSFNQFEIQLSSTNLLSCFYRSRRLGSLFMNTICIVWRMTVHLYASQNIQNSHLTAVF